MEFAKSMTFIIIDARKPPDSEIECSRLGDENLNDVLTWIEICHRSHQIDLPL
jgi:hypothetical protein